MIAKGNLPHICGKGPAMSFLDSLRRYTNPGKITLELDQNHATQSGQLTGQVRIRSKSTSIKGQLLEISLSSVSRESSGSTNKVIEDKTILAREITIGSNQEEAFSFALAVPKNAPLTYLSQLSGAYQRWVLTVSLQRNLWNQTKKQKIEVKIGQDFQCFMDSCETLPTIIKKVNWNRKTGYLNFDAKPKGDLSEYFTDLKWELRQSPDTGIFGTVNMRLSNKSIRDYLKSAIGSNQLTRNVKIPAETLLIDPNTPNSAGTIRFLEHFFQEAKGQLISPEDNPNAGWLSLGENEGGNLSLHEPNDEKAERTSE